MARKSVTLLWRVVLRKFLIEFADQGTDVGIGVRNALNSDGLSVAHWQDSRKKSVSA